jgi:hypothetical protein
VWIQPGRRYRVRGPEVASPLGPMSRRALILKADDFGGRIHGAARGSLEVIHAAGGVAALGLITQRLLAEPEAGGAYRRLHRAGFELWFHGCDHGLGDAAEFRGRGADEQAESLRRGRREAAMTLGLELQTFGAPGNAYDEQTAVALRAVPELRVWLMGPPGCAQPRVLRQRIDAERPAGALRPAVEIADELSAMAREEVGGGEPILMQVHPFAWSARDLRNFERLVMLVERDFRWTTPSAWLGWERDREKLGATPCGPGAWELDATHATQAHRLELARDCTLAKEDP